MLPVINATRTLLPKGLAKSVLSFVHEPIALARIEYQFSIGDPSPVRGVIFELLRTGGLCAPALHTQPLSLHYAAGARIMNRRRVAPELDPAAWPAFDTGALPKKQRSSFTARRQAVELYAANAAVAEIERRTGVDRHQLYRLLDHCVAPSRRRARVRMARARSIHARGRLPTRRQGRAQS